MSYKSYRSYTLRFRGERSKLILGENRPGAFAFLPHDRGPILGCRIEADKGHRFVLRRSRDIDVMQLEELMIDYPADAHGVLGCAAVAEFSNDTPVADQFIQQRILELGVTSIRGSWGLRAHRDSEERKSDEQGKTLHDRDNDRLSSFARCQKR